MESEKEYWWDKLSRILTASNLPKVFEISINNTPIRWNIDPDSEKQSGLADELPVFDSVLSKKQLLLFTWRMIKPLSFDLQNELVEKIIDWAGQPSMEGSVYLPMTLNELKQMANSKLFEIGAQTR